LEFRDHRQRDGNLPVTPPYAEITEATIEALIDRFYARVRRDPVLGPIFESVIADDTWPVHLNQMYAFWSSVMLGGRRYSGNPVNIHRRVPGIAPALFANWPAIFEATAAELFVPEKAAQFKSPARRIAESLKLALFFRANQPLPEDLRCPSAATSTCA
jgi:hemoglobin